MTVVRIQWLLASVFWTLGGWCLVFPQSVLDLAFQPAYQSNAPIVPFLVGCFGAQAMIAGLFAAFSRFTTTTFIAYGIGLFPFFVFDYWFFARVPLLTPLGLVDAVGNLAMLGLCFAGWRAVKTATT